MARLCEEVRAAMSSERLIAGIVTEDAFPYGVRCAVCLEEICTGEAWASIELPMITPMQMLLEMLGVEIESVVIVCASCSVDHGRTSEGG